MFKFKGIIFIFLGLILIFGLIFIAWYNHKENSILKQALQQQEQMIKQKNEQIQNLQRQLQILQKEQMDLEKKIKTLKEKQKQISKPQTTEEIIKAFKELGYDAVVK
jgi:peptidoglycan hydrolase CwlO-like protein